MRPAPDLLIRRRRPRLRVVSVLLVLAAAWAAVGTGLASAQTPRPRAPVTLGPGTGQASVLADRLEQIAGPPALTIATGNVEIAQGVTRLLADRVEINQDSGEVAAQGRVVFFDGDTRLVSDRVDYNLKTGTGVVHNGQAFAAPHYRLSGERLERVGENVYSVRRGTFTTCEGDNPDWSFRVGQARAEIDEIVSGTDASFWVRNIPLIPWVPYFAAAIKRERQSGFLMPRGGFSSEKGFELGIPYYWAIDDSQDLTVVPYVVTERGVGLAAEYRYILSTTARGELSGFMIPEFWRPDRERDALDLPLLRGAFTYRHQWEATPRTSVKADVNYTSDDRIFREYGDALIERSRDRAETNVFVSHRWDAWTVAANVLWYQDLNIAEKIELQRVPDVRLVAVPQPIPWLRTVPGLRHVLFEMESSFVNYVRDVGSGGMRVDAHPRLSLPVPVGGLFTLTPFVGGRGTLYTERVIGSQQVAGITVEQTVDDTRLRGQAEWGVEAVTRVARVFPVGGRWGLEAVRHVIEPRMTLLQVRGTNQDDIPQYDPRIDAIGNTDQLALSLIQRLYAKTAVGPNQEPVRWEAVRLTLAQPLNLRNVGKAGRSPWEDFVGELIVQPNWLFAFRTLARYNYEGTGVREATVDASVNTERVAAVVGYRYDHDASSNVVNASLGARLHTNVDAYAATHWDIREGRAVENRFGLDFRFQCFTIMVEYVNRPKDEDELRFAVGLLGIGTTGSKFGTGTSTR
jgi:LPS-assembly protein